MRATLFVIACCLTAAPVVAQEYEIDITGSTSDQQSGTVTFDIDSASGTQVYNSDGSFSFTGLLISNFMANINGTPLSSSPTGTMVWSKDQSDFGGFTITGPGGPLYSSDTDFIGLSPTVDPNAPVNSLLSQGIFPVSFGGFPQDNLGFEGSNVKITPLAVGVPEPGLLSLTMLAGLLLARQRHRAARAAATGATVAI